MIKELRKSNNCILSGIRFFVFVCFFLNTVGCFRAAPVIVTMEEKDDLPEELKPWVEKLIREGERNAVVNLTEIAALSLKVRGDIPPHMVSKLVDVPLDRAIQRIETIYADTPMARRARSLWHDEASKDFKGEPYERTFVYLLRGLRYYEAGDFENARACFITGILQDALSVEGMFAADMATFEYLIALCNLKTGNTQAAEEALKRAQEHCPDIRAPQKDDNLLVVSFAGNPPTKSQIGKYKEVLLITTGFTDTNQIDFSVPWFGTNSALYSTAAHTDDMGFQALTRGGRLVDEINEKKASAKNTAEATKKAAAVGSILAVSAAVVASSSGNTDVQIAFCACAAFLAVVSVTAHLIAKAIKPEADIRCITTVPGNIHLWSGRVIPGNQILSFQRHSSIASRAINHTQEIYVPYGNDHVVALLYCP